MKRFAAFVKKNFCNTKYGDWLINQVRIRAIDEKMYDIPMIRSYKRDMKNPSKEMKEAITFFKDNNHRVQTNLKYLSDEESKKCYLDAIKYRKSHDRKDAPRVTKEKYFLKSIFTISDKEILVDGGAFVGDTVKSFRRITHDKYNKIICFEPDEYNYKMLKKYKADRVMKYNLGLWNEDTTLYFFNNGSVGSKVITNCEVDCDFEIKVNSIDNIRECEDATFIKLDVEGSEMKALEGAKKVIQSNKPKLAVCLYHSNSDMVDIIEYVKKLVPEYRLYVRHHSKFVGETILYATI